MVSLVERDQYCKSPILRLGTVMDAFECAELVGMEASCSTVFTLERMTDLAPARTLDPHANT